MDERVMWGLMVYNIKFPDEITYLHPKDKRMVTISDWKTREYKTDGQFGYIEVKQDD